jgi:L-ascorbate metabolism protein UlaG (beta-lactamase superfamily)
VELQYFGANCLRLTGKKASLVVDDNLDKLGLKSITKPTDVSLRTSVEIPEHPSHFTADMPGEYEISGVVIHGLAARAHMDEEGKASAVIYTVQADDIRVLVLGHVHPDLGEDMIEQIGLVDIAIVPVGGNGFTLDGVGALQIIKEIEPKVVIPVHYADKVIKYPVAQAPLAEALKNMGIEPAETVAKFRLKPSEVSDTTRLIILERS